MSQQQEVDFEKDYMKLSGRIWEGFQKYYHVLSILDCVPMDTDLDRLNGQAILSKIRDFLDTDPNETYFHLFLMLLAHFPISMCERDISPQMQHAIGYLYLFAQEQAQEDKEWKDGALSFDDLALLFQRSKATIKVCVDRSVPIWHNLKLKVEQEPKTNETTDQSDQTNEQPTVRIEEH